MYVGRGIDASDCLHCTIVRLASGFAGKRADTEADGAACCADNLGDSRAAVNAGAGVTECVEGRAKGSWPEQQELSVALSAARSLAVQALGLRKALRS